MAAHDQSTPFTVTELDLVIYRVINEHFRQDVREFWVRSNFYLLVQAGLISVFVATGSNPAMHTGAGNKTALSLIVLAGMGLVLSLLWFTVARASVFWIRKWRQEMIELDNLLNRHRSYSRIERYAADRPLKSPSYITQYVPFSFTLAWLALLGLQFWR
jgi:hypothetical protein